MPDEELVPGPRAERPADNSLLLLLAGAVVFGLLAVSSYGGSFAPAPVPGPTKPEPTPEPCPGPGPCPSPSPCPGPGPCPRPRPRPHGDVGSVADQLIAALAEGGPLCPDGKPVTCDLPVELRHKNLPGRDRAGCCVFASLMHSARFQNVRPMWDFLETIAKNENGGGWPQKVDQMMAKYCPGVGYVQHTGGDPEFLKAAMRGGRMLAVTYCGRDQHYGPNTSVAHMVNLVRFDTLAVVLDNNFIGENQLVSMLPEEFLARWKGKGGGWAVALTAPRPFPVPHN